MSLDFQSDLNEYLEKANKDVDQAVAEFGEAAIEQASVADVFRQGAARKRRVLSPSSLDCPRRLFYGRAGAKKNRRRDGSGLTTLLFGNLLGLVFAALADALYDGEAEVEAVIQKYGIYGHCDYLFIDPDTGEAVVLEFKTLAKDSFMRPAAHYYEQAATYAKCVGAERAYLVCFWMDRREFRTIEVDIVKHWREAKRKFMLAEQAVKCGIPPSEGPPNKYIVCRSCSYRDICLPGKTLAKRISKING